MTAKEEYISLCHEAFESRNEVEFHMKRSKCEGYSAAMKALLGLNAWGSIVMETDLSFPSDIPVCAGIPIYYKQQIENQSQNDK